MADSLDQSRMRGEAKPPRPLWREACADDAEIEAAAGASQIASGIGQNVSLFGRTFHFQTELGDAGLRTEIFLGGRLVATRKVPIDDVERYGDVGLRHQRISEHHQDVVSDMSERARRHREARNDEPAAVTKSQQLNRDIIVDSGPKLDPAMPGREPTETGLRVRGLLADFRRRLVTDEDDTDLEYLERARLAFAWVLASPVFEEVRLDEQLRVHLLQDQIGSWHCSDRDHRCASQLLNDIRSFSAHLAKIDQRAEFAGLGPSHQTVATSDLDNQVEAHKPPRLAALDREGSHAVPRLQPGTPTTSDADSQREVDAGQINFDRLAAMGGFIGVAVVDGDSGVMLGAHGGGSVNLELAAAGSMQVVRTKRKTIDTLKLEDQIDEILISLGYQYHLIRPVETNDSLFLYLVLDRDKANLALARQELRSFGSDLNLD